MNSAVRATGGTCSRNAADRRAPQAPRRRPDGRFDDCGRIRRDTDDRPEREARPSSSRSCQADADGVSAARDRPSPPGTGPRDTGGRPERSGRRCPNATGPAGARRRPRYVPGGCSVTGVSPGGTGGPSGRGVGPGWVGRSCGAAGGRSVERGRWRGVGLPFGPGGVSPVAWLVVRPRWGLAEAPGGAPTRCRRGRSGARARTGGWWVGRGGRSGRGAGRRVGGDGRAGDAVSPKGRRQVRARTRCRRGAAGRGRVGELGRGYGVGGFPGGSAQVREPGWGGVRSRWSASARGRPVRREASSRTVRGRRSSHVHRVTCTSGPARRVAGHARLPAVAAHAVPAGPWRARRVVGRAARPSVAGGSVGGGVVGRGGMEARRASVLMHPPFPRTGAGPRSPCGAGRGRPGHAYPRGRAAIRARTSARGGSPCVKRHSTG